MEIETKAREAYAVALGHYEESARDFREAEEEGLSSCSELARLEAYSLDCYSHMFTARKFAEWEQETQDELEFPKASE